jgi:pimeloyl-ACP methyl ester carboxylesterase
VPPSTAIDILGPDVTPDGLIDALPESLRAAVASGRRQAERLLTTVVALVRDTSLLADVRSEPTPDASALQPPTLLAYGDRSSCLAGGRLLAAQIPQAQLHVLPGGHYLHLDARAELARLLGDHLRG